MFQFEPEIHLPLVKSVSSYNQSITHTCSLLTIISLDHLMLYEVSLVICRKGKVITFQEKKQTTADAMEKKTISRDCDCCDCLTFASNSKAVQDVCNNTTSSLVRIIVWIFFIFFATFQITIDF